MSQPILEAELAQELENFWNNITSQQKEKLKDEHAQTYTGTDDDMPGAFESWAEDLSMEDIREILQ